MTKVDLTEHAHLMKEACRLAKSSDRKAIINAFVHSLTTRDLERRSALGSYAHLWAFEKHRYVRVEGLYSPFCAYCGIDVSREYEGDDAYDVERTKWGGVRHDEVAYAVHDLTAFAKMEPVQAQSEDWDRLSAILKACATAANLAKLHKAVAPLFTSNKNERDILFQILGYCGVLCPDDCPSYAQAYVPFNQRGDGDAHGDRRYPFSFWRGAQVNWKAVETWFDKKVSAKP